LGKLLEEVAGHADAEVVYFVGGGLGAFLQELENADAQEKARHRAGDGGEDGQGQGVTEAGGIWP